MRKNYLAAAHSLVEMRCFFQIEVHLTSKGLKEVDTVIKRVFQAIHNMQDHPLPSYLFEDLQKMNLLHYQYMPGKDFSK